MELANEELFEETVEDIVSNLPANEEENVFVVELTVFIEDAREELFEFIVLDRFDIDVAADELFVVTVLVRLFIDEFNEDDVTFKEELKEINWDAAEELNVVNAPLTSVIDAANEALSNEPVPAAAAAITSIRSTSDEDKLAVAFITVFTEAANDELVEFSVLVKLFIAVAADELFVVIVLLILLIDEFSEEDAA
jgi:hypothetical protein